MKREISIILIIAVILLESGGCICSTDHVTRTYLNRPSENVTNVTIYIYKTTRDTLNIYESNTSKIKVIEKIDFFPGNTGGGEHLISGYVRFANNGSNSSVYIRLWRVTDGGLAGNNAYANVEVYLPQNTSYIINYVGIPNTPTFKWPD